MGYKFNPFTGSLDWVLCDAEVARIACEKAVEVVRSIQVTDVNVLGNKNFFYDATACKWVEAPPQLVTDDEGTIIMDTSEIEGC
jgi:hypothetical protein